VGLHEVLPVARYYEIRCPWCEDQIAIGEETYTDAHSGQTYHMECITIVQRERHEEYDYEP
jgi:hypothetical protein